VLELLRYRIKKTKVAEVSVDISRSLRVACRAQQIEQVIGNLVANAVDSMAGPETARKRLAISGKKEGGLFRLRVENTGPEIAPELHEKIFEPFFTTKKASEGTGLGLSLCRQIVDAHGGRIWAETPPAGGAAFVAELPCGKNPAAGRKTSKKKNKVVSCSEILVVDDDDRVASMLARALSGRGNEVCRASSLSEGKELLRTKKFDVVISDIVLGDGTGLELFESCGPSGPPFLFMTGNVMDGPLMKHFEDKKLAYLKKPFDLEDLFSELAAILGDSAV